MTEHMSSTTSSTTTVNERYILPGDNEERRRLSLQHEVLRVALGEKSFIAPVPLSDPMLILDAGTGPGNWIEDVSKILHPNSILHGIDINGGMFPTVRPFNASFSIASILDLPDAWNNRFDFVHQRFLIWALSTEEWMRGLHEAFRVLRPGGWLQIVEPGNFQGGGEHTERMGSMMQETLVFRGLRRDIADAAPRFFEGIGFEGVEAKCFHANLGKWAGDIGTTASGTLRAAFRSLKPFVLRLGGLGMKSPETEFDELLEGLEREWDESGGAYVEVRVIYGRKPLSTV